MKNANGFAKRLASKVSVAIAAAMVIGSLAQATPAQAAVNWENYTTKYGKCASTQEQSGLETLLTTKSHVGIYLKTTKNNSYEIPEGRYTKKRFWINAPNATVINKGVMKVVKIMAAQEWSEGAKGNSFSITAKKMDFQVKEDASVNKLYFKADNAKVNVAVDGEVVKSGTYGEGTQANVVVSEGARLESFNGAGNNNTIVMETAKDSEVGVVKSGGNNGTLELTAGEGSTVKTIKAAGNNSNVTVEAVKGSTVNKINATGDNGSVIVIAAENSTIKAVNAAGNGGNVTVEAAKGSAVETVKASGTGTVNLKVDSEMKEVIIDGNAKVKIEGETEKLTVTATENAKGATIETSVPVETSVAAKVELTLKEGAEGSTVTKTDEKVEVGVKNDTTEKVEIATEGSEKKETVESGDSVGEVTGEDGKPETDEKTDEEKKDDSETGSGGSSGGSTGGDTSYVPGPSYISLTGVNVSGTYKVGETLTAAAQPSGATAAWKWQRADVSDGAYVDITGASSATYSVKGEDAGKYLRAVATGNGGYTGTQYSAAQQVADVDGTFYSFSIAGQPAEISGTAITVKVPLAEAKVSWPSTFTVPAGTVVKVGGTEQTSGVTENEFKENGVEYIVSGSAISTTYTVKVIFTLSNEAEFKNMLALGGSGGAMSKAGFAFCMTNDIVLSSYAPAQVFWGTLDGGGHTLSGLGNSQGDVSIATKIVGSSCISNLKVSNPFNEAKGMIPMFDSAAVGANNDLEVKFDTVEILEGSMTLQSTDNNESPYLCFTFAKETTFENCINRLNITGMFANMYTSAFLGGYVGKSGAVAKTLTFKNCINYGTIQVPYAGFLTGNGGGDKGMGDGLTITVEGCQNMGQIIGSMAAEVFAPYSHHTLNQTNKNLNVSLKNGFNGIRKVDATGLAITLDNNKLKVTPITGGTTAYTYRVSFSSFAALRNEADSYHETMLINYVKEFSNQTAAFDTELPLYSLIDKESASKAGISVEGDYQTLNSQGCKYAVRTKEQKNYIVVDFEGIPDLKNGERAIVNLNAAKPEIMVTAYDGNGNILGTARYNYSE